MCLFKRYKYFSHDEISIMLSENKKIIFIKDKIYDFSSFYHPGDIDVFKKRLGKDVSTDFKFHSIVSQKVWDEYFIGKLKN